MLDDLEKLITIVNKDQFLKEIIRPNKIETINYKNQSYPIFSFSIGSKSKTAPVLFLTGGVHGLERIGAQLAWSLLKTTVDRLVWDKALQSVFQNIRLVVTPLLNPVGYHHFRRSNADGIDLMRNSPIKAIDKVPFLVGGHRYSSKLPWYQGPVENLARENQALQKIFEDEAIESKSIVALDFHSGFGMKDRLWFPFSYTKKPFDHIAEMNALTHLFEQTHPYHIYQIEPQSEGYLLNGDMWDYLYLLYREKNPNGIFLPITLEMGSWNWVRKNPMQIFSIQGVFNPIKEHRIKRTYRRHHLLYDFLLKALYSNEVWSKLDQPLKIKHTQMSMKRWYDK